MTTPALVAAIMQFCCCWRAWACEQARSPRSRWKTSTGEAGRLRVWSKGGRECHLPIPAEVGEAIAAYLQDRPRSASRSLFLRARAPVRGLKQSQAVGTIVKRALERAGINSPRKGAHQFRHALATQMLSQGASLTEIGELLRHSSPQTRSTVGLAKSAWRFRSCRTTSATRRS